MRRKVKTLLILYSAVQALELEEFLPKSVFRAWGSGERYTTEGFIRTTSGSFRILNLRACIACWNCVVGLILTPI